VDLKFGKSVNHLGEKPAWENMTDAIGNLDTMMGRFPAPKAKKKKKKKAKPADDPDAPPDGEPGSPDAPAKKKKKKAKKAKKSNLPEVAPTRYGPVHDPMTAMQNTVSWR
jgi:hypothetical protein